MQLEFNLKEGRKRRDAGIKTALDHANRVNDGWADGAFLILEKYLKTAGDFMTEDVRDYAHNECFYPLPPDQRAWGGVIAKAAKRKMIRRVAFAPAKAKNVHANIVTVWRKID